MASGAPGVGVAQISVAGGAAPSGRVGSCDGAGRVAVEAIVEPVADADDDAAAAAACNEDGFRRP